jgi:hypothetical protein
MFVVYDHRGKPRGRGATSGEALHQAMTKAFRGIHPTERRRAWLSVKAKGWTLHEHRAPGDA